MVSYGPWTTITGIRQSEGPTSGWPPTWGHTPTAGDAFKSRPRWTLTQSFASYGAGEYPHNYPAARGCCLVHAAQAENGGQGSWDIGECDAIGAPNVSGSDAATYDLVVGAGSSWRIPGIGFLLPSTAWVDVAHAKIRLKWFPLWMLLGLPPYGGAREVHAYVLMQIPGWADAVYAGQEPEVEILRVDGEAKITTVGKTQANLNVPTTIRMHTRSSPTPSITPYSSLGTVIESVPSSGGTSGVVTFPDMQIGDSREWDLSSAWVAGLPDPGPIEANYAEVSFVPDFIWDIRVRFQVPDVLDVCRWRNRDDGLGITAAARARTGTSLQRGMRFRGYR